MVTFLFIHITYFILCKSTVHDTDIVAVQQSKMITLLKQHQKLFTISTVLHAHFMVPTGRGVGNVFMQSVPKNTTCI